MRSLTQEHARELYWIRAETLHLEDSAGRNAYPQTGRVPTNPSKRAALLAGLASRIAQSKQRYEDCLSAYENAFGPDATEALSQFVKECIAQENGQRHVQRELF